MGAGGIIPFKIQIGRMSEISTIVNFHYNTFQTLCLFLQLPENNVAMEAFKAFSWNLLSKASEIYRKQWLNKFCFNATLYTSQEIMPYSISQI